MDFILVRNYKEKVSEYETLEEAEEAMDEEAMKSADGFTMFHVLNKHNWEILKNMQ